MFTSDFDFNILEELTIGTNTKLRLIKNIRSKNLAIQTWGSMQQTWVTTCRYKVEENWDMWKRAQKVVDKCI
jgi:hypothetical protein